MGSSKACFRHEVRGHGDCSSRGSFRLEISHAKWGTAVNWTPNQGTQNLRTSFCHIESRMRILSLSLNSSASGFLLFRSQIFMVVIKIDLDSFVFVGFFHSPPNKNWRAVKTWFSSHIWFNHSIETRFRNYLLTWQHHYSSNDTLVRAGLLLLSKRPTPATQHGLRHAITDVKGFAYIIMFFPPEVYPWIPIYGWWIPLIKQQPPYQAIWNSI